VRGRMEEISTQPATYGLVLRTLQFKQRVLVLYVGYSESKYRLRISLAHPRDCHFSHVQ